MPEIGAQTAGTAPGFAESDTAFHTQAMTRLANTESAQIQQNMADKAAMMKIMRGDGRPPPAGQEDPQNPTDLVSRIEGTADKLMTAGYYEAGSKLANEASLMRSHAATVRREQLAAQQQNWAHQEAALKEINGVLAGVTDERSYDNAIGLWEQQHPDDPVPQELRKYNPQMVDAIRKGTPEGLKRIQEDRQAAHLKLEEDDKKDQSADRKMRLKLEERRVRAIEEREQRLTKVDGPKVQKVGEPSKEGIALAESLLGEEFKGLPPNVIVGKDAHTRAALDIASDAKARMAANSALSLSEATQQAVTKAKADGDFEQYTEKNWYGGGETKDRYVGGGKTPETALTLPADKKLKAGRYYQTPKGVVLWDGKKGTLVGGPGG